MISGFICIGFMLINLVLGQDEVLKFALIQDKGQEIYGDWFKQWLKTNNIGSKYDLIPVTLEEDGNIVEKVCDAFSQGGTFILDISWSGYETVKEIAADFHAPYLRADVSISSFLDLLDKYLDARNSTDVAIIFDNAIHVEQALYYWVDTTRLRMVITEHLDKQAVERLQNMRPSPNNYALLTTTDKMETLYSQVASGGLLKLAERWNLVFLDFDYADLSAKSLAPNVNLILPDRTICCSLKRQSECKCSSEEDLFKNFIEATLEKVTGVLETVKLPTTEIKCNDTLYELEATETFYKAFGEAVKDVYSMKYVDQVLRIRAEGSVEVINADGGKDVVAKYVEGDAIQILLPDKVKPVKPFYRIGTTFAMPWSYEEVDPRTGTKFWTGYCIDFAAELSKRLNFDYEIVTPKKGTFGKKDRYGNWDGIIGDLARGETDIAVAALTMTADREEVVDYVAPYLEQVGISIVMRKPVRKTSLFKFMTVLKLEVWLSIVGALVVTGFMIWLLDKYSPYSARNNSKAYPYPCREFNLKESFWFALTSFTPQGGGEAPKALSGRTLVAAYWLFVVLMLATFTANLAAFLTVERMQTPVQSLEQLARQSRINYTVVESSETHQYFINMKHAEDTLYRMWKELTLNASTDETQYRVWDYPIREQYGQILIAINDSMPVESAKVGFEKVNEYLDADFAFIHDSAEIKYEISRNCNLTEVGEVFAEKPYALAVQQGSHLQDRLSIMILDLQKDRFFEGLVAKYWNHSNKGDCALSDDNEGITLESLGGVFIATLFGLALAMITLAGEVFYYKRKKKIEDSKPIQKKKQIIDKFELSKSLKPGGQGTITIGESFKPVINTERLRVSHIALYPRARRNSKLPNVD